MWSIRFAAVSYDLLSVCEGVKNNVEKMNQKAQLVLNNEWMMIIMMIMK